MPRTTRCPNCDKVLNIPEAGVGRRLRCPQCATKFFPDGGGSPPRSTAPGVDEARPASSLAVPPVRSGRPADDDDLPFPMAPTDLRETFDAPLLMDDDTPASPPRSKEAGVAGLFDEPVRPKKVTTAEARLRPRRCRCGSVVPAGMSLCQTCGLDLDTGQRIDVEEMLEEVVAAPPPQNVPMGVIVVGMLTMFISTLLAGVSFYIYIAGMAGERSWGYLLLGLVCCFGIFASYKFLKGRSARFLLAALLLGACINIVALIILPLTLAAGVTGAGDLSGETKIMIFDEAPEDVPLGLQPVTNKINWDQFTAGLAILAATAALMLYIMTPGVRMYFAHRR
ncbi:hypothetical protein BH23PLA1_BH23PLA1_00450 [soil metagenome]